MINLAGRDIRHHWGRYLFTGMGLGLLIGVTLTMAGVYRGLVDDGKALIDNSGADLWVVQQGTLGPYAEPSSLHDDIHLSLRALPGVADVGNVTYQTMQVRHADKDVRVMVAGVEPNSPGAPLYLVSGRPIIRGHYEAVADAKTGFKPGDRIKLRHNEYTVVGVTRRMVSSGGDPMLFIPLKDAQEEQFVRDADAIVSDRRRLGQNPQLNPPGAPGVLEAVQKNQFSSHSVNAALVRVAQGHDPKQLAETVKRWKRLGAYTKEEMTDILVVKMIAVSARQIFMFLVILTLVSAAIIAFIIYTMTIGKIREIAVLKLVGTRNLTLASMILQEALGLGLIGFMFGKVAATVWAPYFPKYVLLVPGDALRAFAVAMAVSALASLLGIRTALKVDPAEAIGG